MCPAPARTSPAGPPRSSAPRRATLTSSIWRNPSRSRSSADESAPTPAQATRTSIGPTAASIAATAAVERLAVADVGGPARRPSRPARRSSPATVVERPRVAVDQAEPVPARRQGQRRRAADPAARRRSGGPCRGSGDRVRSRETSHGIDGLSGDGGRRPASRLAVEEVARGRGRTPRGSPRAPGAWRPGTIARPAVGQVLGEVVGRGEERRVLAVDGQRRGWRSPAISSAVSPASALESSPQVVLPSRSRRFSAGQADRLAELEQPLAVEVQHLVEELAEVVPVLVRELDARRPRASSRKFCQWPQRLTSSRCRSAGKYGSERTTASTRSGASTAACSAITPPKLWPTSVARSIPSASISASRSAAWSAEV